MPLPAIVGAAIPSLIGGIASLFGQKSKSDHERRLNERTIQAQKELAEYGHSKDLEMWNRANEYNAPTQQMSRLREAGLNPRLIYGASSGQAAGTAASTMPKYQAPRPEYNYSVPISPEGILSMYNDFRKANAEVDLLQQQRKKAEAEATWADMYNRGRAKKTMVESNQKNLLYKWSVKDGNLWNRLDSEKKQVEKRNDLLDTQIKYYLYNNIGSATMRLLKDGFDKISKQKKPIYNKNNKISNMFNTGDKLKWRKNKVFENYTPSEFENYIRY